MSEKGRGLRPRKVALPSSSHKSRRKSLNVDQVCCHVNKLVLQLQDLKLLEAAYSLVGMVTAYGHLLQKIPEFYKQLLLAIYKLLEDAKDYNLRTVLLHLLELIASNGQLSPSALSYFKRKAELSASCEEAFNAALIFGLEVKSDLELSDCSLSTNDSYPKSPSEANNNLIDYVNVTSGQNDVSCLSRKQLNDALCLSPKQLNDALCLSPKQLIKDPIVNKEDFDNNVFDEENLANFCGNRFKSASLTKKHPGNSFVSQVSEKLVKEEKGNGDDMQSFILPSSTVFQSDFCNKKDQEGLANGASGSDCSLSVLAQNGREQKEESEMLKDERKIETWERFLKVRGDVFVCLSSESKDHLEEVYDVLKLHFNSAVVSVENSSQILNNCDSVNSRVRVYSREFLLKCRTSFHSRKIPANWDQLSQQFPGICLMQQPLVPAGCSSRLGTSVAAHLCMKQPDHMPASHGGSWRFISCTTHLR